MRVLLKIKTDSEKLVSLKECKQGSNMKFIHPLHQGPNPVCE